MQELDFKEVAELINHSGLTEIRTEPKSMEPGHWCLYEGANHSPIGLTQKYTVLYIYSSCTKEALKNTLKSLPTDRELIIIIAASLKKKFTPGLYDAIFKEKGIRFTPPKTSKEFFVNFIQTQIKLYSQRISKDLKAEHFVEPKIETPSGLKRKYPNPIEGFLVQDTKGVDESPLDGTLFVLLAEPGQGKTYTSSHIASRLIEADSSIVPICVNSEQWVKMPLDDTASIWKTIIHSFKYFQAPIGWVEGCEEQFIKVALKAGIFRIIFDGFDEYVLWNQGKIDATSVLQSISDLATNTKSRIVITARKTFWEADVDEKLDEIPQNVSIYTMLPFDEQHARNYFAKRFHLSESRVSRCMEVYKRLAKMPGGSDVAGRGFILNYIAALIEHTSKNPEFSNSQVSITSWVTLALCEREKIRQALPVTAEQQIEILRDFAQAVMSGTEASTEILKMAITCQTPLDSKETDILISKLKDHPLITKDPRKDEWKFTQDQIRHNLLAERLIKYCTENEFKIKLSSFVQQTRLEGNLAYEVALATVDQLFTSEHPTNARLIAKDVISSLLASTIVPASLDDALNIQRSLATTISLITLNRITSRGIDRKERASAFVSLFPNNKLENLVFLGQISHMDFEGIIFKDCIFKQVGWVTCQFSHTTKFGSCRFYGGSVSNSRDFGMCEFEKPWVDDDARIFINLEQIRAGKRSYQKEDLRSDFDQILRRFRDRSSLKNITVVNLKKGATSNSPHRDQIIDALSKSVIEYYHPSSNAEPAYSVRHSARTDVLHYFTNGVMTGSLKTTYEGLMKHLDL